MSVSTNSLSRPRSRWKIVFQIIIAFLATGLVSFMMWKSYCLAATALGSFGWARPRVDQEAMDVFDASPRLRFEKDGRFKIAVFEDLHFGEGEDNRKFYSIPAIQSNKTF
jgi:hypothetical protein